MSKSESDDFAAWEAEIETPAASPTPIAGLIAWQRRLDALFDRIELELAGRVLHVDDCADVRLNREHDGAQFLPHRHALDALQQLGASFDSTLQPVNGALRKVESRFNHANVADFAADQTDDYLQSLWYLKERLDAAVDAIRSAGSEGKSVNPRALFEGEVPTDPDIRDLATQLQTALRDPQDERSQRTIAREYTGETEVAWEGSKASQLIARINKMRTGKDKRTKINL